MGYYFGGRDRNSPTAHYEALRDMMHRYRWQWEKDDMSDAAHFEGLHLNLLMETVVDALNTLIEMLKEGEG